MARYLLDTDTCIHLRRARSQQLVERFASLRAGDVAMSVITLGELHRGALRSVDPANAMRLLERIVERAPALALPASAGALYGEVRHALEQAGAVIGGNDLWIAAHALAAGLTLVSGNVREFSRVANLQVEDWIGPR